MKNLGNTIKSLNFKGKTFAIALILLLTISAAFTYVPAINAGEATNADHNYAAPLGANGLPNVSVYAGLTIAPNPIGIGQSVQVIMIIDPLPASTGVETKSIVTGGWHGFVLTVTKPDGTTQTFGPYESDVSGTYQIVYTPDTVGTYYFQFTFPGETVDKVWGSMNGDPIYYKANFLASTSGKMSLTVQEEPVTGYIEAGVPLPTEYWSSPINGQNRYWSSISGPWLQSGYNATGSFNPYTYAPDSAHILWTTNPYPVSQGGIVGGDYGSLSFGGQNSQVGGFSNPLVAGGFIYYNGPVDASNGTAISRFYCAELSTGKIRWSAPGSITCAQILNWRSQQTKITRLYLWSIGSTYNMYDGNTGALLETWKGAQSGTVVLEPPTPSVVGQDIGGAAGGGALLVYTSGYNLGQKNNVVVLLELNESYHRLFGSDKLGWTTYPRYKSRAMELTSSDSDA